MHLNYSFPENTRLQGTRSLIWLFYNSTGESRGAWGQQNGDFLIQLAAYLPLWFSVTGSALFYFASIFYLTSWLIYKGAMQEHARFASRQYYHQNNLKLSCYFLSFTVIFTYACNFAVKLVCTYKYGYKSFIYIRTIAIVSVTESNCFYLTVDILCFY